MLNLNFIRAFVTLAETGSFNETAKRLGLAQSTVSLQLKRLETALGITLIDRSHAGCALTVRGRAALPHAKALLQCADTFRNAANGGKMTIGCSGNIAAYYISKDLKRFLDSCATEFAWDMEVATNPQVAELLLAGALDVAAMEWPAEDPSLDVRAWRTEPLVVIVPKDHPLAGAGTITTDELFGLELIGGERGSGTGTLLARKFGRRAGRLRVTRNLHSTEAVKCAVRAGLGCSIVLAGAVEADAAAGKLAALTVEGVELEKTFYVAIAKGLPETALPARLAAFLAQ
jgi:DNA-binding transcriptional LysR family regulator